MIEASFPAFRMIDGRSLWPSIMGEILLRRLMAALLMLATVAGTGQAWAEGKQNFRLKNRTGYVIEEVYVSPSNSDEWEEDVMGRDVLADGDNVDIAFSRHEHSCIWDVKVVFEDEVSAEWEGFNLCEVSTVAIFYDRKKDETWAEYK